MWGIVASIAGPILGGLLGNESSENAADAQVRAGQESNATQLAMFNQNRADMAPWRDAGTNALRYLGQGAIPGGQYLKPFSMADFQADPGYGFRLAEGLKALDRTAAARGNLLSGATLKGAQRYGQDLASQEYGSAYNRYNQDQSNQFNRLAALSGIGQTTAQQVAGMGANVAQSIGQTQQGMGNARASGYVGSANALSGGLAGAYNNYQGNQLLNKLLQSPSGGGGTQYSAPWADSQPEYGY